MSGDVPDRPAGADVVVVGGGAAGLSTAVTARAAGLSVLLLSDGPLGGDCTWHGCVPTKALLEAAAAGRTTGAALDHAESCVARLARSESPTVLESAGVSVVRDRVVLRAGGEVPRVVGRSGSWRPSTGVVLATGSRPRSSVAGLPAPADRPTGARVSTTEGWQAALRRHLADSADGPVVVVGGGASGVELAQALARLGLPVTLVESAATLLPGFGRAGEVLATALVADGARVLTAAGPDDLAAAVGPRTLVLLAVGRAPDLRVLEGWDGAPLVTSPRGVEVDAGMSTSVPGLRAAGDVTGLHPSTHVAAAAGRVAAAGLLGLDATLDTTWAPRVVYTDPEVAAVGVLGGARRARVPLSRVDRAVLAQLPEGARQRARGGFAELWTDPDGRVSGALVVSPHAGELVSEAALVGRLGLTVGQWVGGVPGVGATSAHHAYPTWSWVWREAADRLLGR